MALTADPLVSVVIPARDEGAWVRRTVEAILQTAAGQPLEILVVDDGSGDGCCDFLREGLFSDVARVVMGEGRGSAVARNSGAAEARGEALVFMDAHVLPDPGWREELVGMLEDSDVAIAGLAIRNLESPECVGHTYIFVDENLRNGWLSPPDSEPYDTPLVAAGCMALRREVFEEIGGFDPGGVRWGIEDIEVSLRAWRLGFRCRVSPRVQVAHYFKTAANRSFVVYWEEYDVNLLRCVLTHFSGSRLEALLAGIRSRPNFEKSMAQVAGDAAFWERRDALRQRFLCDEDDYFQRFSVEYDLFETRLRELGRKQEQTMPVKHPPVVCPQCHATNVGIQTHCLICNTALPVSTAVARPSVCANPACGKPLKPGTPFCSYCGTRVEAMAAPVLPPIALPTVSAARACRNPACGQEVAAGLKFCTACGWPVS